MEAATLGLVGTMKDKTKTGRKRSELTDKQRRFILEYIKDLNGTQAAIRAGYKVKGAAVAAFRMLTNDKISAEIQKATERCLNELEITDKKVLQGLAKRSFYDVRNFFDKKGNPLEIHELDDITAAGVAGYEFVTLYEGSGDQKHAFGQLRKMKLVDAGQNLERLGRYLGLFKDRHLIQKDEFDGRTPEELRYFAQNGKWPDKPSGNSGVAEAGSGEKVSR